MHLSERKMTFSSSFWLTDLFRFSEFVVMDLNTRKVRPSLSFGFDLLSWHLDLISVLKHISALPTGQSYLRIHLREFMKIHTREYLKIHTNVKWTNQLIVFDHQHFENPFSLLPFLWETQRSNTRNTSIHTCLSLMLSLSFYHWWSHHHTCQ